MLAFVSHKLAVNLGYRKRKIEDTTEVMRTDNVKVKRMRTKKQIMIYTTLRRKLNIEHH